MKIQKMQNMVPFLISCHTCILVTKTLHFYGKIVHKIMYWKIENLNKVVYQISYRYRQIFLIHYQLLEYRLKSISVHH